MSLEQIWIIHEKRDEISITHFQCNLKYIIFSRDKSRLRFLIIAIISMEIIFSSQNCTILR